MADKFIGLKVSVLLNTSIRLEGIVSQLEPASQQMILKDVTLLLPGQPPYHAPLYGVYGKDIKDIQVFESMQTPVTTDHHVLDQPSPSVSHSEKTILPTRSISKNRRSKQNTRRRIDEQGQNHSWAGEDVSIFKEEEFDFQKNLNMFDKAKIFAEIRESDETGTEELLVTLNRLPKKKINLAPSENVLGTEQTPYHDMEHEDEQNHRKSKLNGIRQNNHHDSNSVISSSTLSSSTISSGGMGDESDNDSQTPEKYMNRSSTTRKKQFAQKSCLANTTIPNNKRILTTAGVVCPTLTPMQMAQVESEGSQVSSMFEGLTLEGAGRGTALLALQLLHACPSRSVTILAGYGKKATIGLIAARHLFYRGCSVTVCMAHHETDTHVEIAQRLGVTICYDLKNKKKRKPTDLIVDALLGIDEHANIQQKSARWETVCPLIDWAKRQAKPILSIDFPTGVDADTGHVYHSSHFIHPQHTLCLNAPKTGCQSSDVTGDLYLIDTGIPRLCWKRAGIKGNTIPWGADFLVALRYDSA